MTPNPKPLIITFHELVAAMTTLHQGDKALIASLHDIWLMGAPTPNSIIRNPKHYDPRLKQAGNHEQRIVLPQKLAQWIHAASEKQGFPYTWRQSVNLALGIEDFNLDGESY